MLKKKQEYYKMNDENINLDFFLQLQDQQIDHEKRRAVDTCCDLTSPFEECGVQCVSALQS